MMRSAISLIFMLAFALSAQAQTVTPEQLEEIAAKQAEEQARETQLNQSRQAVRGDIETLKTSLTRTAQEAEHLEAKNRDIQNRLALLEDKAERLRQSIYGDRQSLSRLLAAMQRAERNPPPALAVTPEDAANAARAAQLMSTLSESLKLRADSLSRELTDLQAVRVDIESETVKLRENEAELSKRRANIKDLVSQKSKLEASISADHAAVQKRVASLASEADSLRDLIRQFESIARGVVPRLKPKKGERSNPRSPVTSTPRTSIPADPVKLPPGTVPFEKAQSRIKAPVRGRITKSYSSARQGITVSTQSKAAIISPYAGRVEFAGAFKNFQNVIILNMGGGYFILLTGIGETYVNAGEMVAAGEALGLMPFNTQETLDLYIEIRKNGSAVNPMPWLGTAFASQG